MPNHEVTEFAVLGGAIILLLLATPNAFSLWGAMARWTHDLAVKTAHGAVHAR